MKIQAIFLLLVLSCSNPVDTKDDLQFIELKFSNPDTAFEIKIEIIDQYQGAVFKQGSFPITPSYTYCSLTESDKEKQLFKSISFSFSGDDVGTRFWGGNFINSISCSDDSLNYSFRGINGQTIITDYGKVGKRVNGKLTGTGSVTTFFVTNFIGIDTLTVNGSFSLLHRKNIL